jgi:hypothetical protein
MFRENFTDLHSHWRVWDDTNTVFLTQRKYFGGEGINIYVNELADLWICVIIWTYERDSNGSL